MIKTFKDSSKINLILTVLFVVGIALSAYALYRLPSNLMIPYGYEAVFNATYLIVGLSFLLGLVAVTQAMRYKKELIVYRDRVTESGQGDQDASDSKNTISIETVK